MTYTLEQIRERIGTLVPDVKKLEFGCIFLWKEELPDELEQTSVFENWVIRGKSIRCLGILGQQIKVTLDHVTTILGRDPSLADVMIALNYGIIDFTHDIAKIEYKPNQYFDWDLSKPLSGQSQETLDFIGSLII